MSAVIMSTHAHSMVVEDLNIGSIGVKGSRVRYSGSQLSLNWLHAAVPTPTRYDNEPLRVARVYLRFRMIDENPAISAIQNAEISSVHVYDAERRIATHDGLAIQTLAQGWQFQTFDVPGDPEIEYATGISIGLQAVHFYIDFAAVGAEFIIP